MEFDYSEGRGIWGWVEATATVGTAGFQRQNISTIFERNDGMEIGRNNYFETFPIEYQHFTGFGQDNKAKARLVLHYEWAENAGGGAALYAPPILEYFPGTNNIEVPYDANENSAIMEIEGVFATDRFTPQNQLPVIVSGPGVEIERLSGFDGMGRPDDQAGVNREFPIIMEVVDPVLDAMETWRLEYNNLIPTDQMMKHKSGSLLFVDGAGMEILRFNLFEMIPFSVEGLPSGRSRATIYHAGSPDRILRIEDSGPQWGDNLMNNPATDTRMEISGITTVYAEVEINPADRTISLVYGFGEGGSIYGWLRDVAHNGTTQANKKAALIGATNYFGCFPIRFQFVSGFERASKTRVKAVLSYDFTQP